MTYEKLLGMVREVDALPELEQLFMNKRTFRWLQDQWPLLENDDQYTTPPPLTTDQYVIKEHVPDGVMIRWGMRSQSILGMIRIEDGGQTITEVAFPPRKANVDDFLKLPLTFPKF